MNVEITRGLRDQHAKQLTQETSTNAIVPIEERTKARQSAERAVKSGASVQSRPNNIATLQRIRAFEKYSFAGLSKIAFYRALLRKREMAPPSDQLSALATSTR